VNVATEGAREALADAMSDSWRVDLEAEGRTVHEIASLLEKSRLPVTDPPVVLLACITLDEARPWPDARRRAAERDMFVQSLGAALQNILLAAEERGLAGYLKGAPLFCADAIAEALSLPKGWEPTFLVLLGHPHADFLLTTGRRLILRTHGGALTARSAERGSSVPAAHESVTHNRHAPGR
jgi:coenzyme F420-0:L-glutamate ligase/coenzyme F420-1:gamma-L-glutamate ligase